MVSMWSSLFVGLLLAHLVGDFVLQSDSLLPVLPQKTKVDSANRVNISQIMCIFAYLHIRVRAYPRTQAVFLDRKGQFGHFLR